MKMFEIWLKCVQDGLIYKSTLVSGSGLVPNGTSKILAKINDTL